jgi:hypothetical protein
MKILKMTVWRRSNSAPIGGDRKTTSPSAVPDSRAERYFAKAAAYNAAASEMGFLSLEAAVRAGRMGEVVRRAAAPPPQPVECRDQA